VDPGRLKGHLRGLLSERCGIALNAAGEDTVQFIQGARKTLENLGLPFAAFLLF
jgi:hypothetical protein